MCISRSSEVIKGVKQGHFGVKSQKYGQIHMKCIWIDSKFYSDSDGVNIIVIHVNKKGEKGHSGVKTSQPWQNKQDEHVERQILDSILDS